MMVTFPVPWWLQPFYLAVWVIVWVFVWVIALLVAVTVALMVAAWEGIKHWWNAPL